MVALVVVGALAAMPAGASAALKLGVNDLRGWWIGSPNLPAGYPVTAHRNLATRDLNAMAASHLMYRATFNMSEMDTNADGTVDNWTFPDALFKTAAQRGVKPLVMLRGNSAPTTTAARLNFANATKAFVTRFKAGGTFWTANPTLTPKPLDTIELWNEQNQNSYYTGTPQDYGKLLGIVWKKANETAAGFKLVTGGLAETSSNGQTPAAWLSAAFAVADDETGVVYTDPYFAIKGIGFHPYGYPSWTPAQGLSNVTSFKNALTAARPTYTLPPLWITEFGWRYTPVNNPGNNTYSEAELLTRYQTMVNQLLAWGSAIGPIFAYNYRMGGTGINLDDGFGWNSTTGTLDGADTTQAQSGTQRSYGTWFSSLAQTYTP